MTLAEKHSIVTLETLADVQGTYRHPDVLDVDQDWQAGATVITFHDGSRLRYSGTGQPDVLPPGACTAGGD